MLLFTPFTATRFAMHRIYANRINSRGMSRVFCDLHSQKTPRGILPVNSNLMITVHTPQSCEVFGMNVPKSRDIQAKILLPQAIWNFGYVTENGVNSND